MREVIRTCVEVQYKYYNIPVQDRIYIAFGRLITEKRDADEEYIQFVIEQIKLEFEFLEGVWNGEKRKD